MSSDWDSASIGKSSDWDAESQVDLIPSKSAVKKITFMKDSPLSSDVVDDATGEVVFRISTSKTPARKQKTTICDAQGRVVGEYEFNGWTHAVITYRGESKDVKEWLPKGNTWKNSVARTLTTPNGKEYQWRDRKGTTGLKLVVPTTNARAAESHPATLGLFKSEKRRMGIDIFDPELLPYLDALVLSWVVCEKEYREITGIAVSAGSAASAAAVAAAASAAGGF